MSGPYDLSDDRLAQAFREVFQMKAEFDLAEEVRKMTEAQRNWARLGDDAHCACCGKRGVIGICSTCEGAK